MFICNIHWSVGFAVLPVSCLCFSSTNSKKNFTHHTFIWHLYAREKIHNHRNSQKNRPQHFIEKNYIACVSFAKNIIAFDEC